MKKENMLKLRGFFWLKGVSLLILGILLLMRPEEALRLVVVVFAVESLLSLGYVWRVLENSTGSLKKLGRSGLAVGQLLFAGALLFFPEFANFLLSVLSMLLGIGVLIFGISMLKSAWNLYRQGIAFVQLQLIIGMFSAIFGLFIIVSGFQFWISLVMIGGLALTVSGVSLIIQGLKLSSPISDGELEYD